MLYCNRYLSIPVLLCLIATMSWSVTPSVNELSETQQMFDRLFQMTEGQGHGSYMEVVSEDVADSASRGMSWCGTPYQIGDKQYTHGIAYNSNKRLLVQLGKPAKNFRAEIGLENNSSTKQGAIQGQGSVRFHVFVKEKEVFSSPVMRLKDTALPVDVNLDNAESFEIMVDDAGDGRGWDQALWAEAVITLSDNKGTIRLQDIPWKESVDYNPYTFSFLYGGEPSQKIVKDWQSQVFEQKDTQKISQTVIYTDPKTKLEVRVEATRDLVFPAIEWVAYIKNKDDKNSPILKDIQAVDSIFSPQGSSSSHLHWAKGGVASFDDFAPETTAIESGKTIHLQPGGGRSSCDVLPFFNLEGNGGGMITAVGWTGEWACDFTGTKGGGTVLKSGLAKTNLTLYPGEEIRTPRMLILNYDGDQWRGQNILRQYILARHRPQRNGKPLMAPITNGNWGGTAIDIHLDNVKKIAENGLPVEYYWIDAEWHGGKGSWAENVGSWEEKKALYPQGFKPLSDALQKSDRKLMLWFEPERVYKNSTWYKEHREWLLDTGHDSLLLNIGNPEACKFLIDAISKKIDDYGLGCYRQDFNIDPLPFWQANDKPDRVGMTEIRYIEGLYAFWDGLLQRHPDLIIDNCASGGRRLDLETTGRATPFWRTDGPRDSIAHQCHTFGLLPWIPFSATSQDQAGDDYEFRSSMCSSLCLNWWVRGDVPATIIPDTFPFAWAKKTLDQYVEYRKYYYGDFYPLTGYSKSEDVWLAYQLDRPDLGEGMIVVLKRPKSLYTSAHLALQGLDGGASYKVSELEDKNQKVYSGKDMLEKGIEVNLAEKPDSMLLFYKVDKK